MVNHKHPKIQWVNNLLLFTARLSLFTRSFFLHLFQFAKCFLSYLDLFNIDPEVEGTVIAGEIIDYSLLSSECINCGGTCMITGEKFLICHGACNPHRHFHVWCLPQLQHGKTNYICQICNPSGREEFCQNNGGCPDNMILYYKGMCEAFTHSRCLPSGMNQYRCGICMLQVKCCTQFTSNIMIYSYFGQFHLQ